MSAPRATAPDGVLVVDKPSGPSSFGVVGQARRIYRTRKVGHCGTLDPFASGVLVLVFGEATKLAAQLTRAQKGYRASIRFGQTTDTLDGTGELTDERTLDAGWSAPIDWERILDTERQRTSQVPPQFSAIKQAGQRAYALARRGIHTELEARPVAVDSLAYVSHDDHSLVLDLLVSKGYYVRSLARDLCAALGVPGHLQALRRTQSGCFTLQDAVRWPPEPERPDSPAAADASAIAVPPLLGIEAVGRRAMPTVELTHEGRERARKGLELRVAHFLCAPPSEVALWLGPDGEALALGHEQPAPSTDAAASIEPPTERLYRVTRGFKPRP